MGVPGEFSRVYAIEAKVDLQGADPRVTLKDIEEIFIRATDELGAVRGVIIHRSPAWFIVDEGKKTLEPLGMKGRELRALVSYVVADQFFLDEINGRFREIGVTVCGCFSTLTGEAMLYLPDEERDRTAVLIDMGYLSTDVMAVEGDAVIFHKTIPMGGGLMAADVAYGLSIPLTAAEQIKRSYVFGLSTGQETFDAALEGGRTQTFTHDQVAEVLEPRVEEIAEAVKNCIADSGVRLGNWSTVYLTGGGVAINRGGRDYLAGKLDRPVRELPRKAVKLSSPAYSSALGLLDLIIDTIERTHAPASGLLGGIKEFFRSLFGG